MIASLNMAILPIVTEVASANFAGSMAHRDNSRPDAVTIGKRPW